jgi:hypothetical protein
MYTEAGGNDGSRFLADRPWTKGFEENELDTGCLVQGGGPSDRL